jgi:hypothetical protein
MIAGREQHEQKMEQAKSKPQNGGRSVIGHRGAIYAGPYRDECLCAACEFAREVFGEGRLLPEVRQELSVPILVQEDAATRIVCK